MRVVLQIASGVALVVTFTAPLLFVVGRITLDQTKSAMVAAAVVWFATAPLWLGRPKMEEELLI